MKEHTKEIGKVYSKARKEGPNDETRGVCILDPRYSYYYARYVDKQPRKDTKRGVVVDPYYFYNYICCVDEKIIYAVNLERDIINDLLYAKMINLIVGISTYGCGFSLYPINLFKVDII